MGRVLRWELIVRLDTGYNVFVNNETDVWWEVLYGRGR